jgi:nucleotide-binding universal stress UspA family protein
VHELANSGVTATAIERTGDPVEEILALAHELQADMIVMGTHGYGVVQRFLMGSVSDRVAHRAASAVMIVRPAPEAA